MLLRRKATLPGKNCLLMRPGVSAPAPELLVYRIFEIGLQFMSPAGAINHNSGAIAFYIPAQLLVISSYL